MNWYEFLLRNRGEVFERTLEHIGLVGASMAISLADRIAPGGRTGYPRRSCSAG